MVYPENSFPFTSSPFTFFECGIPATNIAESAKQCSDIIDRSICNMDFTVVQRRPEAGIAHDAVAARKEGVNGLMPRSCNPSSLMSARG